MSGTLKSAIISHNSHVRIYRCFCSVGDLYSVSLALGVFPQVYDAMWHPEPGHCRSRGLRLEVRRAAKLYRKQRISQNLSFSPIVFLSTRTGEFPEPIDTGAAAE